MSTETKIDRIFILIPIVDKDAANTFQKNAGLKGNMFPALECSATGALPATHWLSCSAPGSDIKEELKKIKASIPTAEIYFESKGDTKDFILKANGLKEVWYF